MRLGGLGENSPPRIDDFRPGLESPGGVVCFLLYAEAALHHSGNNYGYSFQTIELRDSGAARCIVSVASTNQPCPSRERESRRSPTSRSARQFAGKIERSLSRSSLRPNCSNQDDQHDDHIFNHHNWGGTERRN